MITFDDNGQMLECFMLEAGGKTLGVELPPGVWHTVISMEEGTVFLEVKDGPYVPSTDKDFAAWAPLADTPDADRYMEGLRRKLDMKKEDYIKVLSFFTVSFQFFSLVQNALKETINQGNEWIVISGKEISFEDYADKTSWSDHQVIIPILFNFYHGLEIFLKGLLQFDPNFELNPKHSIEGLSSNFIKNNPKEVVLCNFLKKYTHLGQLPSILKSFLDENKLTINQLYEALRYPTDTSFANIKSYLSLKYKGEEGIEFFKNLLRDIEEARKAAVTYGRSYEPK